jgi:hypothetical protein
MMMMINQMIFQMDTKKENYEKQILIGDDDLKLICFDINENVVKHFEEVGRGMENFNHEFRDDIDDKEIKVYYLMNIHHF